MLSKAKFKKSKMPLSSLKEIPLKRRYDPSADGSNLLNDFYLPCLSVSNRYDRISAYFSSAILKSFCSGLHKFFANKGHIRFIFSNQISPEEMKNIEKGYKTKMDGMAEEMDRDDSFLMNDFEVCNLSYLIEHGLAEVKIAFMLNSESALCHIKAGVFEDSKGNIVYFDGSGNETVSGILRNAENFHVFTNFTGQNPDVDDGISMFEKLWNNTYSPDSVRTEYPCGKLFEKLKSYSKNKIFGSEEEFYAYKNCVVIDIDKENKSIRLKDYSNEKLLKSPMVLKTKFGSKWEEKEDSTYIINDLSVHVLRDIILPTLKTFGIHYILSVGAQLYLDENDLNLEKRIKLGVAIKDKKNMNLWSNSFYEFKNIVDEEMTRKLKDRQMDNAFFHFAMQSSADYSVPGTGKTYISYGLFAYLSHHFKDGQKANHIVVFGPLNCFRAWKDEGSAIFEGKRDLAFFDITEHKSGYVRALDKNKYDVYLFNYEWLSSPEKAKLLQNRALDSKTLLIFDEIHKLKSIVGIRSKAFISLLTGCAEPPIYKLALTGTPLPNSFVDILNYLRILYPDDLYNAFGGVVSENRLRQADNNPVIEQEIRKVLYPTFVRTTKADLSVPLPDPDDSATCGVDPTQAENALLEMVWKAYRNPLLKYIRLIQATSNPELLKKNISIGDLSSLYDDSDILGKPDFQSAVSNDFSLYAKDQLDLINQIGLASKTKKAINLIEQLVFQKKKVLVWCLFIDTIDLVLSKLREKGIHVVSVSGRDTAFVRDQKITSFKYGDVQVLVTNPNTLAESISLHTVCHDAIYLEYGFNLTYMLQSKDRINRVGLLPGQRTHYYYSVARRPSYGYGSIDESILDRLQLKAKRMLNTIESNDINISYDGETDSEDIKEMISNYLSES